MCIRQRIGGSNPPLTAIFKEELVRKYGLFFRLWHRPGGDEKPRPGVDSWRSQLDRPRACERAARTKMPGAFLNNACVGPEGARPRDGPSNGERSESILPSPPSLKKSSYAGTGFFFACGTARGDEKPRPGVDMRALPGIQPPYQSSSIRWYSSLRKSTSALTDGSRPRREAKTA